jgi:selenocysteine lyase/cysteine desulfurase
VRAGRPPLREAADALSSGSNATARASVHVYNDVDDIEPLVEGILEPPSAFFAR